MADGSSAALVPETSDDLLSELRTFLIADVRGYTRFTVERGDEAGAELAAAFAELAREAASKHGGQVTELRGDEALAVFGSARQALRAAMDLQSRLASAHIDGLEGGIPVGIGLDAGEAVRVEGGYRGAALNLAARLCSLAGPGEVLASEGVAHLARKTEGLSYVERGPVELKGFVKPVSVVQIVVESGAQEQTGTAAIMSPRKEAMLPLGSFLGSLPSGPIVARDDELTAIESAIDTVTKGTGQFLLLAGQRGVGKTRLAQEATLLAHKKRFLIATGRCYEPESTVPFFPFIEAITMLCLAAPPSMQSQIPRRWPLLGQILPEMAQPSASTDPPEDQQRLMRTVSGFLIALAKERPVALLIDDLEWADEQSLRLLSQVARQTRGNRVLILGVYRDTDVRPDLEQTLRELSRERLVERITVRRLAPEGTAAMVAATIGDMETSEEFTEFVHRRTRGVPYLIDEMLRSLGGHFRLVREIGAGGMGRVFQAVDTRTGDVVAAKIMFASKEASADAAIRFEQEGAVLASLHHPNIVDVHGTFMQEHASCIIMELLEGRSLAEVLRGEALPLERVQRIALQVAAALASAHKIGIVHRDIKPDNIMVMPGDHVKVTDFGIARVLRPTATLQTMASTGMTLGTPHYMSPEQIDGRKADGRADIYALGAVLYEMLTGRPPFIGHDPMTIAFKHVQEEPIPPRKLRSGLPREWETVILKALAKDPAQRFQSAQAMESALSTLPTDGVRMGEITASASDSIDDSTPRRSLLRALTPLPKIMPRREPTVSGTGTPLAAFRDKSLRRSRLMLAGGAVLVVVVVLASVLKIRHVPTVSNSRQPIAIWQAQAAGKFQSPDGVTSDQQGNVYVSDQIGNHVQKLSSSGQPLAQWGSAGSEPGHVNGPAGLATDTAGDVYVADTGNDRIEKFSSDGRFLTAFGSSGSGPAQLHSPFGLATDAAGNVYVADAANRRVQKLSPGGRFLQQWSAGLRYPVGVALDSHGNLYVSDNRTFRIQEYSGSGHKLVTWGKKGNSPGEFQAANGLALDSRNNVYVADQLNNTVQKFGPGGRYIATWGRHGSAPGSFASPQALAVDRQGRILVAESANRRIQVLSARGAPITSWTATGTGLLFKSPAGLAADHRGNVYVADNSVTSGQLFKLTANGTRDSGWRFSGAGSTAYTFGGIAVDRQNNTFVVDQLNNHVVKLSSGGRQLAVWDTTGSRFGALSAPLAISTDRQGNVYVADTNGDRIVKLSPHGDPLSAWGQSGNGPLAFAYPSGIAVAGDGTTYVVDGRNNVVQEIGSDGHYVRQWGSAGAGDSQFRSPSAVAVDPSGNVYVVDTGNNRIQQFSASGSFTARWGIKGALPGQFNAPQGITVDDRGQIYVADTDNRRIQKFAGSG